MELINYFETYINAQKGVGFNAFVFGTGMLLVALLLHIYGGSQLASGIRNGSFIIGILLFVMGVGLRISQEKISKEQKALYAKDPVEFKISEIERMTKVKNNYPKGQIVMVSFATLSLIAFLLIKSPIWQGVSLVVVIFFVGVVVVVVVIVVETGEKSP